MLLSERKLRKFDVMGIDGAVGRLHDLYFDDQEWVVRYLVVDTGNWLVGRQVLLSPESAQAPDVEQGKLPFNLTREKIKESPEQTEEKTVSEQHQVALKAYYGWTGYWGTGMQPATPFPYVPVLSNSGREIVKEPEDYDPHLRSAEEVRGYDIEARDGSIGHVEDFIIDLGTWRIRYLVLDTRNWLPGKKVLLAPQWIQRIDSTHTSTEVAMRRDQIKNSPEYDPDQALTREYEEGLHEYYGFPKYWEEESTK